MREDVRPHRWDLYVTATYFKLWKGSESYIGDVGIAVIEKKHDRQC